MQLRVLPASVIRFTRTSFRMLFILFTVLDERIYRGTCDVPHWVWPSQPLLNRFILSLYYFLIDKNYASCLAIRVFVLDPSKRRTLMGSPSSSLNATFPLTLVM